MSLPKRLKRFLPHRLLRLPGRTRRRRPRSGLSLAKETSSLSTSPILLRQSTLCESTQSCWTRPIVELLAEANRMQQRNYGVLFPLSVNLVNLASLCAALLLSRCSTKDGTRRT